MSTYFDPDTVGDDGPVMVWKCDGCRRTLARWPRQRGVACQCGASYGPNGQRFRDDYDPSEVR